MRKDSFIYRVFDLYYDGFRHMKLGRTLWAIILIKLFIIFVILKKGVQFDAERMLKDIIRPEAGKAVA